MGVKTVRCEWCDFSDFVYELNALVFTFRTRIEQYTDEE